MKYSFSCYGHENIIAKHKTTLEFTKDSELSSEGDCIVGVKADFSLEEVKKFIKTISNNRKITIIIGIINSESDNNKNNPIKKIDTNNKTNKIENNSKNKIIGKINAKINPNFNSDKEMVIRKSDFISERTFAINADKAAFELDKGLVGFLEGKENKIKVIVEGE